MIAFADGPASSAGEGAGPPGRGDGTVRGGPPSYDEALRTGASYHHHVPHIFDGVSILSRTSSGRSSRSGADYRPLPSIRVGPHSTSGDPRRNSTVTNASNNLSAGTGTFSGELQNV